MSKKILRIYLDNCCYNRPYDDQKQIRISLETQAKIFIQNAVRIGKAELATSFVMRHENNKNPYPDKKNTIANFMEKNTSIFISSDKIAEVKNTAEEIMSTGIKEVDAAHIACAILAKCDYFLTTDDRVLKYRDERLKIINPVDFVKIWEVTENVRDD